MFGQILGKTYTAHSLTVLDPIYIAKTEYYVLKFIKSNLTQNCLNKTEIGEK